MPEYRLYCDNYDVCEFSFYDHGGEQETIKVARSRGWHIFDGTTIGGQEHKGILCPRCAGSRRRALPRTTVQLPGDLELPLNE